MTTPFLRLKTKTVPIVLACVGLLLGGPRASFAQVCSQTLSAGAALAAAISSAAAGSTICLNSGSYGSVSLGTFTKSPRVTVRALTPLGASMSLSANNGANGVVFDGITFTGAGISGATTKNITIQNSAFGTSQLDITTTNFNANNILIDHNTFGAFQATGSTPEGRISVHWPNGPGSVSSGVVITNNTFGPGGCSDGVQLGAYGVVVGPGNLFTGIVQSNCTAHVDAIQGYGSSHSVITGNFFTGDTVCFGFYDGENTPTFSNNVLVGSCVVDLGTVVSNTFIHNTLRNVSPRVGGINQSGGGSGTYTDNIMQGGNFGGGISGSCTSCTFTHNMYSGSGTGTNNIIGTPIYVGGSTPTTWEGYKLAAGSIGKNAASDGQDMGATIFGQGAGTITSPLNLRIVSDH